MKRPELRSSVLPLLARLSADLGLRHSVPVAQRHGADLVVTLHLEAGRRVAVAIVLCANPRLAALLHSADRAVRAAEQAGGLAAVAVPGIGPGLRQALRDRRVGYLTLDGRVYLQGHGLLIDREVPHSMQPHAWRQDVSAFADKSSLILRYLLARGSAGVGVRELAAQLAISPALVSRVMARLKGDGFLVERANEDRIHEAAALLDDWVEFYRRRARRQAERRLYLHARDVSSVMRRLAEGARRGALPQWGLSFHAGASLVAPFAFFSEVHVLIGGPAWDEGVETFARRFALEPAAEEANVILVRPYYADSWHYGLRRIKGLPVVADLQLYLDLMTYPRRGPEQAERIRERMHLGGSAATAR